MNVPFRIRCGDPACTAVAQFPTLMAFTARSMRPDMALGGGWRLGVLDAVIVVLCPLHGAADIGEIVAGDTVLDPPRRT